MGSASRNSRCPSSSVSTIRGLVGAVIHFVNGVMPHRDFAFPQPPGIVLLLSPLGPLRASGEHGDAFVTGRVVMALVATLNVSLLAWLLRHKGGAAMLVAGVAMALTPVACPVSTGVKIDYEAYGRAMSELVVQERSRRP